MPDQRNQPALNHQRKQRAAVTKDCLLRRRAQPQSPWKQPQQGQGRVLKPRSLLTREKPLMVVLVRVNKPLWLNRETRNMATGTAVRNQVCKCSVV